MTDNHPHKRKDVVENLKKSSKVEKDTSVKNEDIILELETKSVMISDQAIKAITKFSIDAMPKEAIGLLSGKEFRPKELLINKGLYVTEGEEYSVSFSDKDFQVFDQLTNSEFCVGWWHSHPGFGLFLSQTDITTHIFSFQLVQPLSVALVVDPMDVGKDGIAKYRVFQVIGDSRKNLFRYNEVASYLVVASD